MTGLRKSIRGGCAVVLGIAASGAALAQAQGTVSISGALDLGAAYFRSGGVGDTKVAGGNVAASSLTFAGAEDLGDGLKASFVLRQLFSASDGTLSGGLVFASEAKAGLKGGFGSVELGRLFNPTHDLLLLGSPSISNFAGAFNLAVAGNGNTIGYLPYWNSAVRYTTPTVSGFSGVAQATWGASSTQIPTPTNRHNGKGYALGVNYAEGPLDARIAYESLDTQTSPTVDYTTQRWSARLLYDFSVAKLFLNYYQEGYSGLGKPTEYDFKMVGVAVPFGAFRFTAEYGQKDYKNSPNGTSHIGLVASYALSKQTSLYGMFTEQRNKGTSVHTIYGAGGTGPSPLVAPGGTIDAVVLGIRKGF